MMACEGEVDAASSCDDSVYFEFERLRINVLFFLPYKLLASVAWPDNH